MRSRSSTRDADQTASEAIKSSNLPFQTLPETGRRTLGHMASEPPFGIELMTYALERVPMVWLMLADNG